MAKQATATASAAAAKKVKVLTEPDLLKAPDKDYMNEAQLAFFRRRLTELREQLLQNADDTGEHLRENEITTDPSDRATLENQRELLQGLDQVVADQVTGQIRIDPFALVPVAAAASFSARRLVMSVMFSSTPISRITPSSLRSSGT